MRTDARRLIAAHYNFMNSQGIEEAQLGYLVRSAMVMLCAAWERYNEDLLLEVIRLAQDQTASATDLPTAVKKTISRRIKQDKNDLSPILLADNGWKNMWLAYATEKTEALNTPNRENLNMLFHSYFGMDEYSRFWTDEGYAQINQFISDRGAVAHNGNRARNITIDELRTYQDMIVGCTIEIDSKMAEELERRFPAVAPVWDRTYPREEGPPTPATRDDTEPPVIAFPPAGSFSEHPPP
ncbi:MAG: hypothetical protein JST66_13990 [Bacteroidetes bacterium]|nr:hypothetical protein [Bacteroidota bacterium]